jgi:hypothetical protein
MKQFLTALFLLGALASCKTQFYGAPHYPGGPQACVATCASQGLEMSGFVYSGEFASSCVCRPADGGPPSVGGAAEDAADASALVGVAIQTDEDEEEEARQRRAHD